ncbi:MAG: nitroreductase [Bauldia sp.]|nr:nitroreductase [Bauldia sp.]
MDALELLKTRRSITAPFLTEPGPGDEELKDILTIASRVPDHGKLTPWRFIVFRGDAGAKAGEALAALFAEKNPDADEKRLDEERNRLARAPLVIGVVSTAAPHVKIPEFEQLLSAGNAAMMMVVAAHALGFAAHWVTEWISYDEDAGRLLGLRPGERFVGFVHIGTPSVPPVDRPRPALEDVVEYWQPAGGGA